MNYRHHFHAGNFADVFKHALLLRLLRSLQRKDKGYLYLDTHAGRGGYDLSVTVLRPDGSERDPEWPQGIGRIWSEADESLRDYLALVRQYNREKGGADDVPQFYPGSPWFARAVARSQDRLALCELREDDAEALEFEFRRGGQTAIVNVMDGYTALRALLPPPERRALVLIDPPFEEASELADVFAGLRESLLRFPSGIYAVWYPLSERARAEELRHQVLMLPPPPGSSRPPPALATELQITGDTTRRLRGCGLLVVNPPWQIETEFRSMLPVLQKSLALDEGASSRFGWLVPDR